MTTKQVVKIMGRPQLIRPIPADEKGGAVEGWLRYYEFMFLGRDKGDGFAIHVKDGVVIEVG